ncbi:MAG TPA: helix-hairpin-helix domain-containing protein [Microvirga sp.]|jgi:DNA uptake protein ComE-like DNA-binding protein
MPSTLRNHPFVYPSRRDRHVVETVSRVLSTCVVLGTVLGAGALLFSGSEPAYAERRLAPTEGSAVVQAVAAPAPIGPAPAGKISTRKPWVEPPVETAKSYQQPLAAEPAGGKETPSVPHAKLVSKDEVKVAALGQPQSVPAPASPALAGRIDLNSASLAELNGLRNGGMIGRAIVQGRPYASMEDLLAKRVLNRATFERIRDQVTVR